MSIMIDNIEHSLPRDNMRTLLYFMQEQLDLRIEHIRRGTEFEHVRVSDVRTFIYATASNESVAGLARVLGVSRQAVHMSIKRLARLGVVALVPAANSRRDMVVHVTERGMVARREANASILRFENEMAEVIGRDGLETLRGLMKAVLLNAQAKNVAAGLHFKPPA